MNRTRRCAMRQRRRLHSTETDSLTARERTAVCRKLGTDGTDLRTVSDHP